MPAAVLVVHDEPDTRELAVTALRAAFLDVIGFDDPMAALNAIEDDTRVRVLVTRVAFGPGKLERRSSGADGESEAAGHEGCFRRSRRECIPHGGPRGVHTAAA